VAATARAQRGALQPPRPDNAQSLAHIDAAKKIAGNDAFLANPFNFFCVSGNARAQYNNAPDLEPTKLFDNVYAIGNSETTVYALSTTQGIVLLDAGFENKAESVLVPQLQKLGFTPSDVKTILLGHGHTTLADTTYDPARLWQTWIPCVTIIVQIWHAKQITGMRNAYLGDKQ
jgi:hypothetical protein